MSEQSVSSTERHEIVARATVCHYFQTTDPEEVPQDNQAFPLSDYGENVSVQHTGYECSCGESFIFGRTAAEHLRSVDTDTDRGASDE